MTMTTGFSHPRNDPEPAPNAAKSRSEHWEHCAFKRIASFRSGAGFPIHHQGDHKADLPFFKVSDMNLAGNETVMAKHNNSVSQALAQELGATIFPPRTIIFPKVGGALLTNKRRVTTQHCCIDNNLMGCTVHRGNPEFVRLLLESIDLGEITKPGPVPAISESQVKNIRVHFPPVEEQRAIVRYLDHTDDLINRYISAKERLIALLEEQRQVVIHQAVTRGLDLNEPLKDSGFHWPCDVPQHWQLQRLKTLCSMKSGDGITTESIEPEGPYPVYGGNGIRGYSRSYTHEGQFVLIGRQGALCGNIHRASGKFWASEHAVVASLHTGHSLDWFVPLLETMNLNQYSIAAAQPGLSVERVMNLSVPVPPSEEQTKIAEIINQADTRIGSTVSQVQRQIDLMNEYRTRLIADVVTGQIDVRNAPVELPGQHL